MKETIKQLEKEIEKHKWKDGNINVVVKDIIDLFVKKAKLQTLKDVCEEIKELIENGNKCPSCQREEYKCIDSCDLLELLKKFQGEEE